MGSVIPLRRYADHLIHLASVLHAAIEQRHDRLHGCDRFQCVDPICQALSELQTASQR